MAGDGGAIITYTQPNIYGRYFKCSKRTAAHLDSTKQALARKAKRDNKTYRLIIIQGCYNTGVAASAGTHDKDSCLDIRIDGMSYEEAQRFLRQQGWAAFYRKPPTFSVHIHMVSLPPYKYEWVAPVGEWVPGQVADYYAVPPLDGLVSNLVDNTWHPADIRATVFSYSNWLKAQTLTQRVVDLKRRKAGAIRKIQDLRELVKRLTGKIDDLEKRVEGLS
jgi:hypothetical protein